MREVVAGVVWIATLAGALLVGRTLAEPEADTASTEEVERLRARVRALEAEAATRGSGAPSLEPSARPSAMGGDDLAGEPSAAETTEATDVPAGAPPRAPATLDLSKVESTDEALRLLLAFAKEKLAAGPGGHLALVRAIDRVAQGPDAKRLFDDETAAARVVYPLLKFAVTHETQMVGLTETVFRTMAEDPVALEGVDNDTLELFTEGFAVALPGAVDEATLDRFRGHAKRILDTPESAQPEAVRRSRNDVSRALVAWTPPLSSAQAAERLRGGGVAGMEALALLRRLSPEDARTVDVPALLGPLVQAGDGQAIWALRELRLDGPAVSALDARVVDGAAAGTFQGWLVSSYLQATGRSTWADARAFVERGLAGGDRATDAFAQGVLNLGGNLSPPDEWVQWLLATYTLNDGVRNSLTRRLPK